MSLDMKAAFEQAGHDVFLLTKYRVPGADDINYVLEPQGRVSFICDRIRHFFLNHRQRSGYYFFHKKDTDPPVKTNLVLDSVRGEFDLIYVLFWQGLISFETVDKLFDRYHAPTIFSAVDYSVMTGGCHFMHDCRKYEDKCGRCPGYRSLRENDFTRYNMNFRRKVYEKVNPVILTNSYNQAFFEKSSLTRNCSFVKVPAIIDENRFKPLDNRAIREKHNIPAEVRNILFFGCQNLSDKRKGMDLLVEALDKLYNLMNEEERRSTLVVSAGKSDGQIIRQIAFETMDKGFVDFDTLAELYSLADVYLSPSVVDAGPMMVSQALMCGTPVIAFKMGLALDVVEGKGTGYCAGIGDTEDFAKGIYRYLFEEDRKTVSERCREIGLETSSFSAFVRKIDGAYKIARSNTSDKL